MPEWAKKEVILPMVGQNSHEHDNHQHTTSMEMSWDVARYVLRPDELEKLRKYVAMYIATYGLEQADSLSSEGE